MSNPPALPVGQPVDLLDSSYISAAGNQESGTAVTATYRLWQGLTASQSGAGTGNVNIADDSASSVGSFGNSGASPAVGTYSTNLLYSGRGIFRLACAVGTNGNAYFNLSVMGVPA